MIGDVGVDRPSLFERQLARHSGHRAALPPDHLTVRDLGPQIRQSIPQVERIAQEPECGHVTLVDLGSERGHGKIIDLRRPVATRTHAARTTRDPQLIFGDRLDRPRVGPGDSPAELRARPAPAFPLTAPEHEVITVEQKQHSPQNFEDRVHRWRTGGAPPRVPSLGRESGARTARSARGGADRPGDRGAYGTSAGRHPFPPEPPPPCRRADLSTTMGVPPSGPEGRIWARVSAIAVHSTPNHGAISSGSGS